jgi:hypothetical protein
MLREIIPAKNEQASVAQYVMHRRECPFHSVWIIEPKPVHPLEYDAIELAWLEVLLQTFARIDDVLSSSKALLARIDFQGRKVLRPEEVGVVKRVPSAAHKQDALVLGTSKKLRKDDCFKHHAVPSFFPRVDSVGDQPTMDVNPKPFERIHRLALHFW